MNKPFLTLAIFALAVAACAKYKTPEQKMGYTLGLNVGQQVERFKDKIELAQLEKGLQDEIGGKSSMDQAAMQQALQGLNAEGGDKAKAGYAIGVSIAMNIKAISALVDAKALVAGVKDRAAGKKAKLNEAEQKTAMEELGRKQQELRMKQAEANKATGLAFLEENKKKPGVKVTASGLQYLVVHEGKGRRPKVTSTVSVHYTGTLADGTKFDSSVDRGQPAEFPLNGVIKGWTEGLQLMKEGAKYRFFIPSELGYGENGQGAIIQGNMPLVFDVELLKVDPPKASHGQGMP